MIYRFCGTYDFNKWDDIEIEFDNRKEAEDWAEEHKGEITRFGTKETARIIGYAVELSEEKEKPQAILYHHKIYGNIWIDFD